MKNLPRIEQARAAPPRRSNRAGPPPSYDAPLMRALVTGGAGFIGSNLVDALTPAEV
jgi:hypothetical protein